MRRREFMALLGSAAAAVIAWPFVAHAQQTKVPRIGYLALESGPSDLSEAFKQGLRDLGWIEGRTIAIEYRWAAGQMDRLPAMAEELVRLQVDLIVAGAAPVAQAARAATQSIPIVMTLVSDPVRTGLVASLARPGGNITGMSGIGPELAGKRFELLRALLPTLARVAFLAYEGDPAHRVFLQEAQDAAERLGMSLQPLVLGSIEEIERAFAAMHSEWAEALMVQPLFIAPLEQSKRIADLAVQHRLLTISGPHAFVPAGGLLCYGTDQPAAFRASAVFVDKILKGAKPGDLPVQQPTKFKLSINLKTAKALGLAVPPMLLATADEVIE